MLGHKALLDVPQEEGHLANKPSQEAMACPLLYLHSMSFDEASFQELILKCNFSFMSFMSNVFSKTVPFMVH